MQVVALTNSLFKNFRLEVHIGRNNNERIDDGIGNSWKSELFIYLESKLKRGFEFKTWLDYKSRKAVELYSHNRLSCTSGCSWYLWLLKTISEWWKKDAKYIAKIFLPHMECWYMYRRGRTLHAGQARQTRVAIQDIAHVLQAIRYLAIPERMTRYPAIPEQCKERLEYSWLWSGYTRR